MLPCVTGQAGSVQVHCDKVRAGDRRIGLRAHDGERGEVLKRVDDFLTHVENTLIAFALFSGGGVLLVNVILRYFLRSGIVWADEYTRYAIIWLTFIGGSAAVRENDHLAVTIILEVVKSHRVKKVVMLFAQLTAILFTAFLTVWGMILTTSVYRTGQRSPSLEAPMWIFYLAIPVGALLMTYRFLRVFAQTMRREAEEG